MTDRITQLAGQVGQALQAAHATLATAESCTGGGIAEAITRIAGSSAWLERGWVTYSNKSKVVELGVPRRR
jgi:nicotinamide-nucleotide amidase